MRAIAALSTVALIAASWPALAAETDGLRPGLSPDTAASTQPATPRPAPIQKEDPFEALGIRAGGFILYPTLTVTGGYTTNAPASAGGEPSALGEIESELLIQSDWARHEATLTLRGGYEGFASDAESNDLTGSAQATARLDLANDWTVNLAAGADYKRDDLTDPAYPDGFDDPAAVTELTSSAALNGNLGRATFTVEGKVDRTLCGDTTALGVPVDQDERVNTVFGGRLRLGYAASGTFTPFVEGEIDRRVYDQTLDDDGIARGGVGLAGRAGVAFDRGPLLKGEISVGTAQEDFDDATLATLRAFTFDGNVVWSPSKLTTVTVDAATTLNPSVDPLSAGSIVRDGSIEIAYAWRDNVMLGGKASISNEAFEGTGEVDNTYDLEANLVWKLNRALQVTASYVHEWLDSTDSSTNYQSDTVKIGLRAQR